VDAPAQSPPAEILCIRCEYPLPDLNPDAVCPECGTLVAHTLRGDRLAAAEPDYLEGLVQGLRLMRSAAYITAGAFAIALAAAAFSLVHPSLPILGTTVGVVGACYAAIFRWPQGLRLLAAPESVLRTPAHHESLRQVCAASARVQAPIAWACVVGFLLGMVPSGAGSVAALCQAIGFGAILLAGALAWVQIITVPWHIRLLASRIPARTLMKSARTTLILGVMLILRTLTSRLWPGGAVVPLPGWAQSVAGGVLALGAIAWPFAMVLLVTEAQRELDRIAETARIRDTIERELGPPA